MEWEDVPAEETGWEDVTPASSERYSINASGGFRKPPSLFGDSVPISQSDIKTKRRVSNVQTIDTQTGKPVKGYKDVDNTFKPAPTKEDVLRGLGQTPEWKAASWDQKKMMTAQVLEEFGVKGAVEEQQRRQFQPESMGKQLLRKAIRFIPATAGGVIGGVGGLGIASGPGAVAGTMGGYGLGRTIENLTMGEEPQAPAPERLSKGGGFGMGVLEAASNIPKSAAGLVEGAMGLPYEATKSVLGGQAGEFTKGAAHYMGAPFGLYGGEEAARAWTLDPVGSAATAYGGAKGVKAGAKVAGRGLARALPEGVEARLVQSASKFTTDPAQKYDVARAVQTQLEEGIPTSRSGKSIEKIHNKIDNLEAQYQGAMDASTGRVSVETLARELEPVKREALVNPSKGQKVGEMIDKYIEQLQQHPDFDAATGTISTQGLTATKRSITGELRESGAWGAGAELAASKDALKAVRSTIMQSVDRALKAEGIDVTGVTRAQGSLINLEKHLEKRVAQLQNSSILPFRTFLSMMTGAVSPTYAIPLIASTVFEFPSFKSRLAIAIHRARGGKIAPAQVNAIINKVEEQVTQPQETFNPETLPPRWEGEMGIPGGTGKLGLEEGGVPPMPNGWRPPREPISPNPQPAPPGNQGMPREPISPNPQQGAYNPNTAKLLGAGAVAATLPFMDEDQRGMMLGGGLMAGTLGRGAKYPATQTPTRSLVASKLRAEAAGGEVRAAKDWIGWLKKQPTRNPAVESVINTLKDEPPNTKIPGADIAQLLDDVTPQFKTVESSNPKYGGREFFIQAPKYKGQKWSDQHAYMQAAPELSDNLVMRMRANLPEQPQNISQIQSSLRAPSALQKLGPELASQALINDAIHQGRREINIPTGETAQVIQGIERLPEHVKKMYDALPQTAAKQSGASLKSAQVGLPGMQTAADMMATKVFDGLDATKPIPKQVVEDIKTGAGRIADSGWDKKRVSALLEAIEKNPKTPLVDLISSRPLLGDFIYDMLSFRYAMTHPGLKMTKAPHTQLQLPENAQQMPYLLGAAPVGLGLATQNQ